MCFVVGHNDPGYLPDEDPVDAATLGEAVNLLLTIIEGWFSIELDDEDFTPTDLQALKRKAMQIHGPGSTVILHGHAFWIQ